MHTNPVYGPIEHKHFIIRAEVKKPFVNVEDTKDWLRRLVIAIGMKLCKSGGPHVDYVEAEGNNGIAGVAMIETSHVSVHCWDKSDPALAQIDVYSCAWYDPEIVIAFVMEMQPTSMRCMLLDRSKDIVLEWYDPYEVSNDKTGKMRSDCPEDC